jgi:hypothetical protein
VAVHRIFEAVHGSAPDIAWRNIANPPVLVMAGVVVLDDLAETCGDAVCAASAGGVRTATTAPLPRASRPATWVGGPASGSLPPPPLISRLPERRHSDRAARTGSANQHRAHSSLTGATPLCRLPIGHNLVGLNTPA